MKWECRRNYHEVQTAVTGYAEMAAPALVVVVVTMGGGGESGAGLVCSAAVTPRAQISRYQISTTHTVLAGYSAFSRPRLSKIFTILYNNINETSAQHQHSSQCVEFLTSLGWG